MPSPMELKWVKEINIKKKFANMGKASSAASNSLDSSTSIADTNLFVTSNDYSNE
jgi:hypothetical protein